MENKEFIDSISYEDERVNKDSVAIRLILMN